MENERITNDVASAYLVQTNFTLCFSQTFVDVYLLTSELKIELLLNDIHTLSDGRSVLPTFGLQNFADICLNHLFG